MWDMSRRRMVLNWKKNLTDDKSTNISDFWNIWNFQLAAILRLGCCCDLHRIVSFSCGLCVFIAGGVFSVWAFASDHFSLVGMIIMLTSILIYVFLSRVDQVRPDFLLQIVFICLYAKSKRSQNKSTHFVPLRKWKATCKPVRTAWCLVLVSL